MPNNVTTGLYATCKAACAYELAAPGVSQLNGPQPPARGLGRGSARSTAAACLFFPRKNRCPRNRQGAPLHGIAWVSWAAWCLGVSAASSFLCQPKKCPCSCKGRHRHIRQSADLGAFSLLFYPDGPCPALAPAMKSQQAQAGRRAHCAALPLMTRTAFPESHTRLSYNVIMNVYCPC